VPQARLTLAQWLATGLESGDLTPAIASVRTDIGYGGMVQIRRRVRSPAYLRLLARFRAFKAAAAAGARGEIGGLRVFAVVGMAGKPEPVKLQPEEWLRLRIVDLPTLTLGYDRGGLSLRLRQVEVEVIEALDLVGPVLEPETALAAELAAESDPESEPEPEAALAAELAAEFDLPELEPAAAPAVVVKLPPAASGQADEFIPDQRAQIFLEAWLYHGRLAWKAPQMHRAALALWSGDPLLVAPGPRTVRAAAQQAKKLAGKT
jgi:hypothetical protein